MSHRQLLSRATEGTDAPTPGYLLVDLAKAANANPAASQDMATYLSRRLASKSNPNIKAKCCKVMARLCQTSTSFRRAVAQDTPAVTAIKDAMHFRGTPDAVRGDTPNQNVRTAAKECLDAVYTETPTSEQTRNTNSMGGVGSHGYSNGSGGGGGYGGVSANYGGAPHSQHGGGGSRMQGIGNPMFADPRNAPQQTQGIGGVVKETAEVLAGMIKDPLARNIQLGGGGDREPPRNAGTYGGPQYGRPPPGQMDLARRTQGQWTMASNRGPGAIDYQRNNSNSHGAGAVGGSWAQAPPPPAPVVSVGPAVADGSYEKNLVAELCPPGGMKPVPPPDKLAAFQSACASLNADFICPVLLDNIEDGQPWIIRAKALCAMEVAIAHGTNSATQTNAYRDFFHACHDEITPLAAHPRIPIREPAQRVMRLLGMDVAAPAAAAPVPVPAAPAPNLLDFDSEPAAAAAPVAPPQQPVAPAPASGGGGSMFGGMQVKAAAAAPVAPAPASTSLLDMATAPAAVAPPAATAAPVAADPFGLATPAPAAATGAESMFGQLSVKDEAPVTAPAAAETAPSSAFGFLNTATPAAAVAASPPPSFDPLKQTPGGNTGSPNAKRTSMTMSPEQMQAMAYQQMMYQQMQMAMAMQARGGGAVFPNLQQVQQPGQQMPSPQKFSFAQSTKPAQKDDKKFDFVKDAMMGAKK